MGGIIKCHQIVRIKQFNIIFELDQKPFNYTCLKQQKLKEVCQKFESDIGEQNLIFLYNGTQLCQELTFQQQATCEDFKNGKILVLTSKNQEDNSSIDENIKKKPVSDKPPIKTFSGFCEINEHNAELQYFCKTHNKLCCAKCVTEAKFQNSSCVFVSNEEIRGEKNKILKENIQLLEFLKKKSFKKPKETLEIISNKIKEEKEKLKLKINNVMKAIKKLLREREKELLLEVEKYYEITNLNNIIEITLEKGKRTDKDWCHNDLIFLINDCLNIENNLKEIKQNLTIYNSEDSLIELKLDLSLPITMNVLNYSLPMKIGFDEFLEKMKDFGRIKMVKDLTFQTCPCYNIKDNIIIKNKDNYCTSICKVELESFQLEYIWKIKILKTGDNYNGIYIGITTIDCCKSNNCKNSYDNFYKKGWYCKCYDGSLYSGPPFNYNGYKPINKLGEDFDKPLNNEIIIIFNMERKSLKFLINNKDNGDSYKNIPINQPLFFSIVLINPNDSIEIERIK